MSVFCTRCGREYDITLFAYGRTIECACGMRVGREMKVQIIHREGGSPDTRFMVDVMLGRLARWLRIIGFDAAYIDGIEDSDLVRISIDEGRILLTRDRALPSEWWIDNYILVESVRPMEQLRQIVRQFDLPWRERLFTRCTVCNEPLHTVDAEKVIGRVPERVLENSSRFASCRMCGRIYWEGSHVERMREKLEESLEGGAGESDRKE